MTITYHPNLIQGSNEWQRYGGMLFVCHTNEKNKETRRLSLWVCGECGKLKKYPHTRVLSGIKQSCGCTKFKKGRNAKHGMKYTPEYSVWGSIKKRCVNENDKDYARYGGAGIGMHQQWQDDFMSFYNHIGPRPKGTTVDRIDNTKGYYPGNVRWATNEQQAMNRSNSYTWIIKGRSFESIRRASSFYGVADQTIHKWVLGCFDYRRGTYTPPRNDCSRIRKYEK